MSYSHFMSHAEIPNGIKGIHALNFVNKKLHRVRGRGFVGAMQSYIRRPEARAGHRRNAVLHQFIQQPETNQRIKKQDQRYHYTLNLVTDASPGGIVLRMRYAPFKSLRSMQETPFAWLSAIGST
jgi:hypothetical protein